MSCGNTTRLIAHLCTNGREGNTPFFLSDLLTMLRRNGLSAFFETVSETPLLKVQLNVQGKRMLLTEECASEDKPWEKWMTIMYGTTGIRFNAFRVVQNAPSVFTNKTTHEEMDVHGIAQAWSLWPRRFHTWDDFLGSVGVEVKGTCPFTYLSEEETFAAIKMLLVHAP